MGALFTRSGYYRGGSSAAAPVPFPDSISDLYGRWKYDEPGSLFEERSSPSTATADGGVVGTWRSIEGNDRDLIATADGTRPIYAEGEGVQHFWKTDGGTANSRLRLTGISGINRNDFGGGMVVDIPHAMYSGLVDFGAPSSSFFITPSNVSSQRHFINYGTPVVNTSLYHSGRRCVITWRSNGTNLKIWVNGELYTGTALSSASFTQMFLSIFVGGSPAPHRMQDLAIWSSAPSDAEMEDVNAHFRSRAGALGDGNLVATLGDSMSMGVGSETGTPWLYSVTNRSGSEWRAYNRSGAYILAPPISAANLVTAGAGFTEKVCVIWMGTNDINLGVQTGAATFDDVDAYRATLQASGWKVVACTLQALPNNDGQATA